MNEQLFAKNFVLLSSGDYMLAKAITPDVQAALISAKLEKLPFPGFFGQRVYTPREIDTIRTHCLINMAQ